MRDTLNLLILGKSGAGKSSLVNYLGDKNIVQAVAGNNDNKELISLFEIKFRETLINIYDTRGIEEVELLDSTRLDEFEANKKHAEFDVILYCINTGCKKISSKETKKILELKRINKNMLVILTADDITKGLENSIEKQLTTIGIRPDEIVRVCSENKKYVTGKGTKQYGKEEIFYAIRKKLNQILLEKIEAESRVIVSRKINTWNLRCKNELNSNKSFFISKDKRRTDAELVDDFNKYLGETKDGMNTDFKDVMKKVTTRYKFLYKKNINEEILKINIESDLCLPKKIKRTYNFAVLDKVEKQLEKYWCDEIRKIAKKI